MSDPQMQGNEERAQIDPANANHKLYADRGALSHLLEVSMSLRHDRLVELFNRDPAIDAAFQSSRKSWPGTFAMARAAMQVAHPVLLDVLQDSLARATEQLVKAHQQEKAATPKSVLGGEALNSATQKSPLIPSVLPSTSNTPVDKVLDERGSVYGNFADNAFVSQALDKVLQEAYSKRSVRQMPQLQTHQREALRVICQKISRIVTGDPGYQDNWVDIAGYAELGRNPR